MKRDSDAWSWLIIFITFALFLTALFLKGFSHDLLLEAGVLMVSVKLIMMARHNRQETSQLHDRLLELKEMLRRVETEKKEK